MRGRAPSAVESPLLIGGVLMALALIGVVISYNASRGLPFVPTYKIFADVPDAAEMSVGGSEVRVKGNRVGVVTAIQAMPGREGRPAFARVSMSLDPGLANLPVDTEVDVRPRSILGAKYLEVIPGRSRDTIPPGEVLPITQARPIVELDEAFDVFNKPTTKALRNFTTVVGDSLAGRGGDINRTTLSARRLIAPLQRVSALISDPATDVEGFITGAAAVTRALLPVSSTFGELFDNAATTLAALDVAREPLGEAVDTFPGVAVRSTRMLRKLNPVVAKAAAITRDIRPGSELLIPASRDLADAAEEGIPLLQRTPGLAERLGRALHAIEEFADDPATNETVLALTSATKTLETLVRDLAPAQLQCNVVGLYGKNVTGLAAEGDNLGTWLNALGMVNVDQEAQQAEPAPNLHLNSLPNENFEECEAGNEPFRQGQRIGNPRGLQSNEVPNTHP